MSEYGSLPFREQLQFLLGKTSVPTRRWADVWRDAHDRGFMVAGAYEADLLADLRSAVTRAIAEGRTLREFRQEFDDIVERRGWDYRGGRNWRTRVIYQTNLRTSYAAGRYTQMRAVSNRRPYWRYRHSIAVEDPREQHLAWDGLILRHDDPWWDTHYPPNGWGCQCYVETLSEREFQRTGRETPDQAPAQDTYEWTDPETGEVHTVPQGVDPGWDYAPGASVVDRTREQMERKARGMPEGLGSALVEWTRTLPEAPDPPVDPAPGESEES